jgi:hypothetical protein
MRMTSPKECLLKRRCGLVALHDAQHEPPAIFDGHNGKQDNPCGMSGIG